MARLAIALLALAALLCLVPTDAQSNTTSTTVDDAVVLVSANVTDAANTTAGNTTAVTACPLTEEALAGVDLMNASMACADSAAEGFCSKCLCSIATALVSGSPTFAAIAASDDASDINLNTLVEQCAGTFGPALLSALSTDSLTALAACDLNAAAMMCADMTEPVVEAQQGPAPVTPQPVSTPVRAASGAQGLVVSALMAAPLLLAVFMA